MPDIVWSLREDCPCISDIGCAQELCNQAAAEIERLCSALEAAADRLFDAGLNDAWADARAALEGK